MFIFRFISLLILFFAGSCGINSNTRDYRIAVDPSWYPLDLMGREPNILGYTRDVIQELARIEKAPLFLVEASSENLIFDLKKGRYEGILSAMQPYPFLNETYDFSVPFLSTGPVLVIPVGVSASSLKNLNEKIIALPEGTSAAMIMNQYPGIIVRFYNSIPDTLLSLEHREIDGAVIDSLIAEAYCSDIYQGKLQVATKPLSEEGFRLVTLHDKEEELQAIFNRGLEKLKEEKILETLQKKWGLHS